MIFSKRETLIQFIQLGNTKNTEQNNIWLQKHFQKYRIDQLCKTSIPDRFHYSHYTTYQIYYTLHKIPTTANHVYLWKYFNLQLKNNLYSTASNRLNRPDDETFIRALRERISQLEKPIPKNALRIQRPFRNTPEQPEKPTPGKLTLDRPSPESSSATKPKPAIRVVHYAKRANGSRNGYGID